ncbi:MAG: polysaccharide biosynthesis protein [Erysipelotrichaceae bacterium]|nr:polysaccharide biosynthesis protein [Erysipelotrichaceae bacterium]
MSKKPKQSFIAGALTGSAGVFISKALGLLYVVPFTAMATSENMVFYNAAYTYYDLLLQICTAGIPFAIAALVAKYANQDDYKTVMLIKKISVMMLGISGFVMAGCFVLISSPLAKMAMGSAATPKDIQTLRNVFMILAIAIIIIPFLSAYRGFYQGLKEMKAYAISQVLEQLSRVTCLLALGAFVVYILKLDNIWAVYMAVLSTGLAGLFALGYYLMFDKQNYYVIEKAANHQESEGVDAKTIIKELLWFGLPYLASSILGNSMNIVNTNFFMSAMDRLGTNYEEAKVILGIIQVQCNKLTSIPQVLSVGFSAGLVPYLTINLENKDYKGLQKNVCDCLDTVNYIGLPLSFCLFALARPIYYVMFGNSYLDLGEICLAWSSLLAITGTIAPICSSMMLTLRYRKRSLIYLCIGFLVKLISFFPLIHFTGYVGAITSSALTSLVIIFLDLTLLSNKFDIDYTRCAVRFAKMCVCLIAMNGSFALLRLVGLDACGGSRFMGVIILGIYGIVGMGVYYYTSSVFKLPQNILGLDLKGIIRKVVRR